MTVAVIVGDIWRNSREVEAGAITGREPLRSPEKPCANVVDSLD